jgi:hypothetical protein
MLQTYSCLPLMVMIAMHTSTHLEQLTTQSYKIHRKIDSVYDAMDGMTKVVVHSTFALEGWDSLIDSYQTHQSTKMHLRQDKQVKQQLFNKWWRGKMHAFQGYFP